MAKKKILVAVTGMSPQIITETVYALYRQQGWLPEKIIVLTTLVGRGRIIDTLLGENGYFKRLCRDYRLPDIEFGEHTIRVIQENGEDLADIRTPEQNQAAADLIVREIGALCRDAQTELHVSIAGGRKSMGFYIGYALSLFGREQDKLSHVLVEEDFENKKEFFYPTPMPQWLELGEGRQADAAQAKVMLAEIPFVRLNAHTDSSVLGEKQTFSQAVQLAQNRVNGVRLRIDAQTRSLNIVFGQSHVQINDLNPMQFALYLSMAEFCQAKTDICIANAQHRQMLTERYWKHYCRYGEGLQGKGKQAQLKRESEWARLQNEDPKPEMVRILQEHRSRIKKIFHKYLGAQGSWFDIDSGGGNTRKFYRLKLLPEQIEIEGLAD